MITCTSCGKLAFGEALVCEGCGAPPLAPTLEGQGALEPALGRAGLVPNVSPDESLADRILAAADGETLVLPAGRFALPRAVQVQKRLTVVGAGAEHTEIFCGGPAPGPDGVVFFGGHQPDRRGTWQVPVGGALELRDLALTSSVQGSHTLVFVRGGMLELVGCRLDAGVPPRPAEGGLSIKSTRGEGVRLEACSRAVLRGCTVRHADDSGVYACDEAILLLVACKLLDNGWAGLMLEGQARAELVDGLCRGNQNGVSLQGDAMARLLRLRSQRNRGAGVGCYSSGRLHVQDSTLCDNDFHGMYLCGSGRVDAVGNMIARNAFAGVAVERTTAVRLDVNRISANAQGGVRFQGGSGAVRGNTIDGHAEGLVLGEGVASERNVVQAEALALPERWPPPAVVRSRPVLPVTPREAIRVTVTAAPAVPAPPRARRPEGDRGGPGRAELAEARRLEAAGDMQAAAKAYLGAAQVQGRGAALAVTAYSQVARLLHAEPALARGLWVRRGCTDMGPPGARDYFRRALEEACREADATYRFWAEPDRLTPGGGRPNPMALTAAIASALPRVRAAAEAGDVTSCYQLGALLNEGLGVPLDPAGAVDWLERAARHHFASALLRLQLVPALWDETFPTLARLRNEIDPPDRPLQTLDPLWAEAAARVAGAVEEPKDPHCWQALQRPYLLVGDGRVTIEAELPEGLHGAIDGASYQHRKLLGTALMRAGLDERLHGYAWAILMVAMGRTGTYQQETRAGRDLPEADRRAVERTVARWWADATALGMPAGATDAAWSRVLAKQRARR